MLVVGAAASIFIGCGDTDERVGVGRQQVIYGDDSRRDLYQVERESLKSVAVESTLALVSTRYLAARTGGALLTAPPLGEVLGLCPGEAFHAQPAAASCSGVLIDENLVLTAGHCVNVESACPDSDVWITNYALHAVDTQPALVDNDVYRCRSIVFRVREVDSEGRRWDFAVIELDRPVTLPQRPVLLEGAALSMGEKVSVVGYPNGLPVKIDTDARISDLRSACGDYFELTADTFEGSSGSGVFDFEARLVGMIVRGGIDYEYDAEAQCLRARRRNEAHYTWAEQASTIAPVVARLCSSGWHNERLCPEMLAESGAALESQPSACTADQLTSEPEIEAGSCALGVSPKPCPSLPAMGCALAIALHLRRRSRTR